jgi:hypothetical protein
MFPIKSNIEELIANNKDQAEIMQRDVDSAVSRGYPADLLCFMSDDETHKVHLTIQGVWIPTELNFTEFCDIFLQDVQRMRSELEFLMSAGTVILEHATPKVLEESVES